MVLFAVRFHRMRTRWLKPCQPPRFGAGQQPVKPAQFQPQAGRRVRLRHRQPCPRRRVPGALRHRAVPARLLQHPGRSTATRRGSRRRPSRWSKAAISSTSAFRTTSATRSRSASIGCRPPWSKPPRRSACRGRKLRIWLYRIPSLIGAIGAVLLTYWTALAFVTRRGAALAGADDVQFVSCSASKRGWPRPTRCCC